MLRGSTIVIQFDREQQFALQKNRRKDMQASISLCLEIAFSATPIVASFSFRPSSEEIL